MAIDNFQETAQNDEDDETRKSQMLVLRDDGHANSQAVVLHEVLVFYVLQI